MRGGRPAVPILTTSVPEDQVQKILAAKEGHFLDMKAKEVRPAKLTKTLSAFANADGGELYVGIGENADGTFYWGGFADAEDANSHLQVFEGLFPLGDGFQYSFLENSERPGVVSHALVLRSAAIRKAQDGHVFLRRGAQNLPISTPGAMRQLERDKGITSFENETVPVAIDSITNSETIIKFMLETFPASEPIRWLKAQRVIIQDKPTVAGVLLFDDLPQAALPKRSAVKVYRYKTGETEGTRDTLDGCFTNCGGCRTDGGDRGLDEDSWREWPIRSTVSP